MQRYCEREEGETMEQRNHRNFEGAYRRLGKCERCAEDHALIAKGLLESFDVINLLLVLEEVFDVELGPDLLQLEDFNSPKTIAAMIERCRG